MKKIHLALAILAMGITTAQAQVTQYWNGLSSSTSWNTSSNEWGATSGADESQAWTNGNTAIIEINKTNVPLGEDITVHRLEYTNPTAQFAFPSKASYSTLTINDSLHLVTGTGNNDGNFILNGGHQLGGDFTYTSDQTDPSVNQGRLVMQGAVPGAQFAPGSSIFLDGLGTRLQMNGNSSFNGVNIQLNAGFVVFRFNDGTESVNKLSGNGTLSNNPGSTTLGGCTVTITNLEIGTDGTIGTFDGIDSGNDGRYILDLASGSTNQFDINKLVGGSFTNDFLDAGSAAMSVDVDGTVIKLVHTGEALAEGDSVTLFTGYTLTGSPVIDDTGATPPSGTIWTYNNGEVQIVSDSDTTPPTVPQNLTADGGFYSVALSWDPSTDAGVGMGTYNVFRSPDNTTYSIIESNVVATSTTDNTTTNANTTYYYKVSAVDTIGNESAQSSFASATTLVDNDPAAPTGLIAVGGNAEVILHWFDNDEPEDDLAGYNVYRSTVSGSGYGLVTNITDSSFTDTNVVNGTDFFYVVRAIDTQSNESGNSGEASATPDEDVELGEIANLLNDPSFTSIPDTNMPTSGIEVFRFDAGNERVQLQTGSATSGVGSNSTFSAPIDLTTHTAVTGNPAYDPATTKLEAIVPDINAADLAYAGVAQLFGGSQDYAGWYLITLDTAGGTYTATSEVANVFLGADSGAEMEAHVLEKWNKLTWSSDPFASGGIAYSDINDVSIEWFHETMVANTIDTAAWFTMNSATIGYITSFDRLGDEYLGALFLGDGTNTTENSPAMWDTTTANWGLGPDGTYALWTNWFDGANAIFEGSGSRTINLATNLSITADELINQAGGQLLLVGVSNSPNETITVTNKLWVNEGGQTRWVTLQHTKIGGTFDMEDVSSINFQNGASAVPGTEITAIDNSGMRVWDGAETDYSGLTFNANGGTIRTDINSTLGTLTGNGILDIQTGAQLTINNITADGSFTSSTDGTLVLGSGTHALDISSDDLSAEQVSAGSGTLTYGGSLTVTDTGSGPLSLGDKFQLFDGAINGSFSSVSLPSGNLPVGGVWYNDLEKDGTISVGTEHSRYEVFNFTEFASLGWDNLQQVLSGSLTNDAGVVVTLTLDSNVGNFAGNANYVASVYASAIAGVSMTTNGVDTIGNDRLDSYGSTNVQNVINTSDDETLRFTVSVSGTVVDAIALKSLRLETFGLDEIAEFENGGGTVIHQDTGGDDTVDFDDVLSGLTELSKANIGSWYLDVTARDYYTIGVETNNTAVSFDDVKFVVGFPNVTYNLWAIDNDLVGDDALAGADPDEDGFSNLYEYGLNGDPNDENDRGIWELGSTEIGGTNYFEYVHAKRSAPNSDITYDLEETDNLVFIPFTNDIPDLVTIEGPTADPEYNSVTNRIPTTDAARFLKLLIEEN
jgi:hypothetical protein